MVTSISRDLSRATLAVLFIAGMIVASFWVLRPFLPAFVWATMIVVATWPLMLRVQSALWDRRGLAVAVMTVVLLLGLIRSEEHTSELQSRFDLVCRLLLEK